MACCSPVWTTSDAQPATLPIHWTGSWYKGHDIGMTRKFGGRSEQGKKCCGMTTQKRISYFGNLKGIIY